jgi:hypothetical protein
MYYKKPYHEFFELVAIVRICVLQRRADGDLDVQFEMADGSTLESIYTLAEYGDLIAHPEGVVV